MEFMEAMEASCSRTERLASFSEGSRRPDETGFFWILPAPVSSGRRRSSLTGQLAAGGNAARDAKRLFLTHDSHSTGDLSMLSMGSM